MFKYFCFLSLKILSIIAQLLSIHEIGARVLGLIPKAVKLDAVSLTTIFATFLGSCVAQVLSYKDGPHPRVETKT